jgi:hypothetical protein
VNIEISPAQTEEKVLRGSLHEEREWHGVKGVQKNAKLFADLERV